MKEYFDDPRFLQSVLQQMSDAIVVLDRELTVIAVNRGFTDMFGYEESEVAGLKAAQLPIIPEHKRDEVRRIIESFLSCKQLPGFETQRKAKDGTLIDVSASYSPVLDEDGKLTAVSLVFRDIRAQKEAQRMLQDSRQRYMSLFMHNPDAVFSLTRDGTFSSFNGRTMEIIGYSEDELRSKSFEPFVAPEYREAVRAYFSRCLSGEAVHYELTILHKNGRRVFVGVTNIPIVVDGEVAGVYGIAKDVTTEKLALHDIALLKAAARELRKSEERFRVIAEHAYDIIALANPAGIVEYISPSSENTLGYAKETYIGIHYTDLIHPEDLPEVGKHLAKVNSGKSTRMMARLKRKGGHWLWVEGTATPVIEDGEIKQIVIISRDVTERKNHEEMLEKLAYYDYMTGLPNRRTFDDRLETALREADRTGEQVAVMLLDGRNFKKVNDQYGHDAGDAVIKEFADRLKRCVRSTDTVARLGGDEMGVILPAIDGAETPETIARRMLASFRTPLQYEGHAIPLGAGIGIALYPVDAASRKRLEKCADEALYEAKQSKADAYRFYRGGR
ncbi:PAS domain S-box protein [Paenibacillus sp.]|uniref:sensor domain-containing protein n=1 Tax=Paenibacillus sp. TaxID=58172 RepID=UPI002D4E7871|nr:PAS domain S-box protein [Paenibacillus sp.]HZG85147.1 PAS domain S-box protein [Paenibacillus sp.]